MLLWTPPLPPHTHNWKESVWFSVPPEEQNQYFLLIGNSLGRRQLHLCRVNVCPGCEHLWWAGVSKGPLRFALANFQVSLNLTASNDYSTYVIGVVVVVEKHVQDHLERLEWENLQLYCDSYDLRMGWCHICEQTIWNKKSKCYRREMNCLTDVFPWVGTAHAKGHECSWNHLLGKFDQFHHLVVSFLWEHTSDFFHNSHL